MVMAGAAGRDLLDKGRHRVLDRGEPTRRQLQQPVPQEQCD
jgi:hypothetical protein